jgi:hypothetical protein
MHEFGQLIANPACELQLMPQIDAKRGKRDSNRLSG